MQLIEGWQDIGLIFQIRNLSDAVGGLGQGSTQLNRLKLF